MYYADYGLTTTQLDGFVYNGTPKLRAVLVYVNVVVVCLSINFSTSNNSTLILVLVLLHS